MNNSDLINLILPLIEDAKELSKEKIKNFAQDLYSVPVDYWDHLWKIPIVPIHDIDAIFPVKLSSLSRDRLDKIIPQVMLCELGKSEAAYVPFEKILEDFPNDAQTEYIQLKKNSSIPYDSIIAYNEKSFAITFLEQIKNIQKKYPNTPQEQLKKAFLESATQTFIHERLHLNTDILIADPSLTDPNQTYHQYGARFDDMIKSLAALFEDYDEVLIDTMAMLINAHSKGNTLDEDLQIVLKDRKEILKHKERNNYTAYDDYDDRPVLMLFTLFPNELTEWTLLELGEMHKSNEPQTTYHNLLLEKHNEVFGDKYISNVSKMLDLAGEYFVNETSSFLSDEEITQRTEMLESIGVTNIDFNEHKVSSNIDFEDFLALIFSAESMSELNGAVQDIRAANHELKPQKSKEKYDIEP